MCENVVHGTEHDHENRKNGRMCLQSSTMSEHIEITPEIIEIRHYLHAHPERSFKEYETSAYIAGVEVPTDAGVYTVILSRVDGASPWLVERFTPPEGTH